MTERVAMVTGAGRGIGRGIALGLAAVGWSIVVNYRGNAQAATETAAMIEEGGQSALVVQADVSDREGRAQMIDATLERFGAIDLLVNNAGMAPRERIDVLEMSEESYDEVMAVNLRGPLFLTQAVAAAMIRQVAGGRRGSAAIINIGSVSSFTSSPARAEYCISKAGMGMMTAIYADRLAEHGINVYEIRPGIIETDMTGAVKEKYDNLIEEGLTPIKRWGQPDDVARAIVALAEGYFPFSTGEILNVDGGFHLRRL